MQVKQKSELNSNLLQNPLFLWICFAAFIVVGVILRVASLSERPLHHDESIHATFAYQWFDNPYYSYYKYDPTYHGPVLYVLIMTFYQLFGVGVTQARLVNVIFGLGVVAAPWFFKRYLGVLGAALASIAIAISPWMVYYSRFLVHDMITVFFTCGFFATLILSLSEFKRGEKHNASLYATLAGMSFGILQAIKLISYIEIFIVVTFVLFTIVLDLKDNSGKGRERNKAIGQWLKYAFVQWAIAYLVSYAVFQTSFFMHIDGFLDGMYRKVLPYWWDQHDKERLRGPTYYHMTSLALHELPLLLLTLGFGFWHLSKSKILRWAILFIVILFFITIPGNSKLAEHLPSAVVGWLAKVKIRDTADVFVFALSFVMGILLSGWYWLNGKRFAAFVCYWAFAALAIFSYAGEKGPWLTGHIIMPMILYVALQFEEFKHKFKVNNTIVQVITAALLVGLLYQTRLAFIVNHVTDGYPNDLFSQVHNSRDVKFVMRWMTDTAYKSGDRPENMPFVISGEPTWAFYFYLIEGGFKKFKLDVNGITGNERFIIVDDKILGNKEVELLSKGYKKVQFINNGWWVPQDAPMDWHDWFYYAWTRQTNKTGTRPMFVYYKDQF